MAGGHQKYTAFPIHKHLKCTCVGLKGVHTRDIAFGLVYFCFHDLKRTKIKKDATVPETEGFVSSKTMS